MSKIKVTVDHYYDDIFVATAGAILPNGTFVGDSELDLDDLTDEERVKALECLKSPKAAKAYFKTKQEGEKFLSLYTNFVRANKNYSADSNWIDYTEDLKVLPFTLNEIYDEVMHDYGYK